VYDAILSKYLCNDSSGIVSRKKYLNNFECGLLWALNGVDFVSSQISVRRDDITDKDKYSSVLVWVGEEALVIGYVWVIIYLIMLI
jgi:hypothetical protein